MGNQRVVGMANWAPGEIGRISRSYMAEYWLLRRVIDSSRMGANLLHDSNRNKAVRCLCIAHSAIPSHIVLQIFVRALSILLVTDGGRTK